MFADLRNTLRAHPRLFSVTVLVVLLLALGASGLKVLSSPEVYSSKAEVRLAHHKPLITSPELSALLLETECEIIRSEAVLAPVITQLHLTTRWAPRLPAVGPRFGPPEAMAKLKAILEAHPLQDTNTLAISVRCNDAREAANIANVVALSYQAHQQELLQQDPPVAIALQVEAVKKAEPAAAPLRTFGLPQAAVCVLGAILLALAAGIAMAWIAFEVEAHPQRPDLFVPLFLTVGLALFGHSLLQGTADLTLSASGSLLLAFAAAAFAHWLREFGAYGYPVRPTTHFGVFTVVFLTVFGADVFGMFVSPQSRCAIARVRLSAISDLAGRIPTDGPPALLGQRFLQSECQVIQSGLILDPVIEALDLCTTWGKAYAGGEKLKPQEAERLLLARIDVLPVGKTSLIEIRTYDEDADKAIKITSSLAQTYRQYCHHAASAGQSSPALRAEIVGGVTFAPVSSDFSKQQRLVWGLYGGLFLAFVAVAGGLSATVLLHRRKPWFGQLLALSVVGLLLAYGFSLICVALKPETYSSAAQVRLRTNAAKAPSAIPAACDLIQSDAVLSEALKRLSLPGAPGQHRPAGQPSEGVGTISSLRKRLSVRPVPNTYLISIQVEGEDSSEPARAANAVATAFCEHQRERLAVASSETEAVPAEVFARAAPALMPIARPNPAAFVLDRLWPTLWSLLFGGVAIWVVWIVKAGRPAKP